MRNQKRDVIMGGIGDLVSTWKSFTVVNALIGSAMTFMLIFMPKSKVHTKYGESRQNETTETWKLFFTSKQMIKITVIISILFTAAQMTFYGVRVNFFKVF